MRVVSTCEVWENQNINEKSLYENGGGQTVHTAEMVVDQLSTRHPKVVAPKRLAPKSDGTQTRGTQRWCTGIWYRVWNSLD